ncbi:hypothetical protein [uncultured Draconibacterium sp.]|uniref:tetratricopeptide repeat protein n=1 Tax=uncultured Draconibacterium sp. TaxID=1573823 RepID=UPI0025DF46E1|nr:hypothetical protein [uncultured Draconibacterium sp.]
MELIIVRKLRRIVFTCILIYVGLSTFSQNTFNTLCDSAQEEVNSGNLEKALYIYDKAFEQGSTDSLKIIWTATICSMCANELQDEKAIIKYNNIAIEYGFADQAVIEQQLNLAKKHKDLETIEKVLVGLKDKPELAKKYTLKLMYFYYNNKRYSETLQTAEELLELNPHDVTVLYFKGVALLNTNQDAAGIEVLMDILAEHPDNEKANRQLGLLYYNKASAVFDKANKKYKSLTEPTRLDFHKYTEEIKKAEGDYKTALPYLEKSNSVAPKEYLGQAISLTRSRLKQLSQDDK